MKFMIESKFMIKKIYDHKNEFMTDFMIYRTSIKNLWSIKFMIILIKSDIFWNLWSTLWGSDLSILGGPIYWKRASRRIVPPDWIGIRKSDPPQKTGGVAIKWLFSSPRRRAVEGGEICIQKGWKKGHFGGSEKTRFWTPFWTPEGSKPDFGPFGGSENDPSQKSINGGFYGKSMNLPPPWGCEHKILLRRNQSRCSHSGPKDAILFFLRKKPLWPHLRSQIPIFDRLVRVPVLSIRHIVSMLFTYG